MLCQVIRESKASMRRHRGDVHGASDHTHGREQLWRRVEWYQRFFNQRPNSGFFEVKERPRPPLPRRPTTEEDEMDPEGYEMIDRQIEETIRAGEEAKANADRVIEEGSVNEVNRWVDRTRWNQYLKGFEHDALLDLIVRPEPESEAVEDAVWNAMDGLGRFS